MNRPSSLIPFLTIFLCASTPKPGLSNVEKPESKSQTVATFSIIAFDPGTGDLGVAVASKFFGVGSVVPWAKAGIGAVATQAWANVRFVPDSLRLLAYGKSPAEPCAQSGRATARSRAESAETPSAPIPARVVGWASATHTKL